MKVAIAGAHGQVAMPLAELLARRGDDVVGLIRNPDHRAEVAATGAHPVVCDVEHAQPDEVAGAVAGADVVVFAAGAGPGSGAERKLTMDRDGAIALLRATGPETHYVMLSAVGAEHPPGGDDVFSVYLRAKAQADAALASSDREWTIVRPGRLTNAPGRGRVQIATEPFRGEIPRADLAAVLAAVVIDRHPTRQIIYAGSGEQPIEEALAALRG